MKTSTKLKIAGFCLLPILPISIPLLFMGYSPAIMGGMTKLESETLDRAGNTMTEIGLKTIDIMAPVANKGADTMSPAITKMAGAVRQGFVNDTGSVKDISSELKKIDELKSGGIITKEEYDKMRAKILGL